MVMLAFSETEMGARSFRRGHTHTASVSETLRPTEKASAPKRHCMVVGMLTKPVPRRVISCAEPRSGTAAGVTAVTTGSL